MSSEGDSFRRAMECYGPAQEDGGRLESGTVGWDDGKPHYDLDGGERTLVKVTLYRGYRPGEDKKPRDGRAGGMQILCRITRPLNFIPEDGEEVLVGIPAGFQETPGAGFILAVASNAPATQHSATKAKMDFGPEVDLVIKARSVTLSDYQDRFITLGPTYGIKMGAGRITDNSARDLSGCILKDGKWMFYCSNAAGESVAGLQLSGHDGTQIFNVASNGDQVKLKMKSGQWMSMTALQWINLYQVGVLGDVIGAIPVAGTLTPPTMFPSTRTIMAV